jgi:hypothetical protein
MKKEMTRIIEKYLSGELTLLERDEFEIQLSNSKDLQEELELQKTIHEAAKRSAIRNEINGIAKKYHFSIKMKWGGFGLGLLLLVVTSVLLINSFTQTTASFDIDKVKKLSAQLSENSPIDNLKSEFFTWNSNDTVLLSLKGVLISIPNNAFLLNGEAYKDPAIIQWQEALEGSDIVKAGLSTVSDDKLLETQGMFSFSAKTPEGKELTINPEVGIYVQIPVDEYKEGMKLFDGEKDVNGNINWTNPSSLDKIPVPISMSELNFYPPKYEPQLNELKARKDKKFRDSLYLSFEHLEEGMNTRNIIEYEEIESTSLLFVLPKRKITTDEMMMIYGRKVPLDGNMNFSEAFILKHRNQNVPDDLKDFPALLFVNEKLGREYLFRKAQWNKVLTDYLFSNSFELDKWDATRTNIDTTIDESYNFKFIPPTVVLSFWNSTFNNTLLSTHEFEARMKVIHAICDKSVLDLYMNNLNKAMWEIDQMAVEKGYPQFKKFVDERVGSLNPNDPHLKGLSAFYQKGIKQLRQQEKGLRKQEQIKRNKWDKELLSEREKEIERSIKRNENSFSEEYSLNHKNVRKQLGRVIGVKILNNTPKNIDRLVMQSTINRESSEFYDPMTGKKGIIKYNNFSFEISDFKKYDKLFAYIFPDKLNSYHRLEGKNGKFTFPLNEDISYDLAIVGISVKGYSYVQHLSVKGGDIGKLLLESVSEDKLDNSISHLNSRRGLKPFAVKDEIRWLKTEQKNYVVKKKIIDEKAFRDQLRPKVFPCSCSENPSVSSIIEQKDPK